MGLSGLPRGIPPPRNHHFYRSSLLARRFWARARPDNRAKARIEFTAVAGRSSASRSQAVFVGQTTSSAGGFVWKARPFATMSRTPSQAAGAADPEWASDESTWLRWLDSEPDCVAPALAAPQVLTPTPHSLYLLCIIHWVVHNFHRLCVCPLFTFSHIHGFRLEDLLCAPPISTLHIRMAAAPQTPSHPDVVAYYFARLQAVLTVQWLPHGMPAGSQIFHRMVPGTPPGHWLREVGAALPPQGSLAADRALPPGPPLAPPSPIAQAPPWLPLVHNEWMPPRTNLDLQRRRRARHRRQGGPSPVSRRRRPQASHPLGRTRFRRSTSPCPLWIKSKSRVTGPSLPPQPQPAPRCGGPGPPTRWPTPSAHKPSTKRRGNGYKHRRAPRLLLLRLHP